MTCFNPAESKKHAFPKNFVLLDLTSANPVMDNSDLMPTHGGGNWSHRGGKTFFSILGVGRGRADCGLNS